MKSAAPFKNSPAIKDITDKKELKKKLGNRISIWVTAMSLGDTICTTPTIRKIKQTHPDCFLDVYAYHPEIFLYNPHVDVVYRFEELLDHNDYYTRLNKYGYQKYFIPYISSEHEPKWDCLTTNLIDFCSLMGMGKPLEDSEKWLEVPYSETEKNSLFKKVESLKINLEKAVVIHPSITWPSRTWPFEKWQELTDLLIKAGFQVVAVGQTAPKIARKLENASDRNMGMHPCPARAINLIDSLPVLETVCLLDHSKCLITLDSGLLHMGFCTDINIVGMFTCIHPKFRQAWRKEGFEHKFIVVPPTGECKYCSCEGAKVKTNYFGKCALGDNAQCLPDANIVSACFEKIVSAV